MYDATDDPYTYENSTVLVNKLDLRGQGELDDFEAEITNARARGYRSRQLTSTLVSAASSKACQVRTLDLAFRLAINHGCL
jgi:fido (protein-threonine AMPylation protein)